jgi:hypothetical protein
MSIGPRRSARLALRCAGPRSATGGHHAYVHRSCSWPRDRRLRSDDESCSPEINVKVVDAKNAEVRFLTPGNDDIDPRRFSKLRDKGKQGDEYLTSEGSSTWRCRATLAGDASTLLRECRGQTFLGLVVVKMTFAKLADGRLRQTFAGGVRYRSPRRRASTRRRRDPELRFAEGEIHPSTSGTFCTRGRAMVPAMARGSHPALPPSPIRYSAEPLCHRVVGSRAGRKHRSRPIAAVTMTQPDEQRVLVARLVERRPAIGGIVHVDADREVAVSVQDLRVRARVTWRAPHDQQSRSSIS